MGKLQVARDEETVKAQEDTINQLKVIHERLGGVEAFLKILVNIEKLQQGHIGDLHNMFCIYLKYAHNIDITPGDEKGEPVRLRKFKVRASRGSCLSLV